MTEVQWSVVNSWLPLANRTSSPCRIHTLNMTISTELLNGNAKKQGKTFDVDAVLEKLNVVRSAPGH